MTIDDKRLSQLEQMTRLRLDPATRTDSLAALNTTLATLSVLDALPAGSFDAGTSQENIWREDSVVPSSSRETLLQSAARHNEEFFIAPQVVVS